LSTPSLTALSIFSNGESIIGNLTVNGTLSATNEVVSNNVTINGNLTGNVANFTTSISSNKIYGTLIDWMTLVRGYNITPTLCATIATGTVYTYIYNSSPFNVTYYRYIATDNSLDAFYTYFSGVSTLSGLVAKKSITI
jgi:hypothetical protein